MSNEISPFRLESPHIAEYVAHMEGPWELEYEQLEGGEALHSIAGLNIGRDSIYTERSTRSVGIRGCVDPGILLICLPATPRGRFWSKSLDHGSALFVTNKREVDVSIPDLDNVEAIVDEREFREHYRHASGREPDFLDEGSTSLRLPQRELRKIEGTWRGMASGRTRIPTGYSLCKAVAWHIAGASPEREDSFPMNSRQYKQVRDCISHWENTAFELSVADICHRAGVSERTLGVWFRSQCGLSPYQYLQSRRLNLAHCELLAADPSVSTVTEIAIRFGFHELGRFAGVYRKFFGELPSQTLQRRSGDSARSVEIGPDW